MFKAVLVPNSLSFQCLNGSSFNPVPALVAKLLTVWVRTSERGRAILFVCLFCCEKLGPGKGNLIKAMHMVSVHPYAKLQH